MNKFKGYTVIRIAAIGPCELGTRGNSWAPTPLVFGESRSHTETLASKVEFQVIPSENIATAFLIGITRSN